MTQEILGCLMMAAITGGAVFVYESLCYGSRQRIKRLERTIDDLNVVVQNKNAYICVLENRLNNG